jgi:hypothetical protein
LAIGVLVLLVAAQWTGRAAATVMEEATLEELILEADAIVVGRVERVATRVLLEADSVEPRTFTELRVDRVLKGTRAARLTIQERGGRWQGGGMHIDGTPEYAVGDEVLVFLARHPDAPETFRTHGMVQGRFTVVRGIGEMPTTVRRDLSAIAFARLTSAGTAVVPAGNDPAMRLEDLTAYVAQVLRTAEGA